MEGPYIYNIKNGTYLTYVFLTPFVKLGINYIYPFLYFEGDGRRWVL